MMSIYLNSSPVDIWRVSPQNSTEIDNLYQVKSKLLDEDLPFSLRAISYIRVCSVVMQILVKEFGGTMPNSYSTILSELQSTDSQWWCDCYISLDGYLLSKNKDIQSVIQPINDCMSLFFESK